MHQSLSPLLLSQTRLPPLPTCLHFEPDCPPTHKHSCLYTHSQRFNPPEKPPVLSATGPMMDLLSKLVIYILPMNIKILELTVNHVMQGLFFWVGQRELPPTTVEFFQLPLPIQSLWDSTPAWLPPSKSTLSYNVNQNLFPRTINKCCSSSNHKQMSSLSPSLQLWVNYLPSQVATVGQQSNVYSRSQGS